MNTSDILMILAVLLSPFVAVFAQRAVEDRKEKRGRRLELFKSLMGTRGSALSDAHVRALNMIELEFDQPNDEAVRRAWRAYLDHLNTPFPEGDGPGPEAASHTWGARMVDLLDTLLGTMGRALGYDFDSVLIRKGAYSPRAHGDADREKQAVRRLLIAVLGGDRPIHFVAEGDDETTKARKALMAILEGRKPLHVLLDEESAKLPVRRNPDLPSP